MIEREAHGYPTNTSTQSPLELNVNIVIIVRVYSYSQVIVTSFRVGQTAIRNTNFIGKIKRLTNRKDKEEERNIERKSEGRRSRRG